MPLSFLCIRMALTYAVIAMVVGLHMAASQDHTLSVAHAHLAIIGWFGLFSTGMLFRVFPALAARGGMYVAAGLIVGTPLIAIGLGLLHYGARWAEPIAILGSVFVALAAAWLAVQLWRLDPAG